MLSKLTGMLSSGRAVIATAVTAMQGCESASVTTSPRGHAGSAREYVCKSRAALP